MRVAVVQLNAQEDLKANLARVRHWVERGGAGGGAVHHIA